MSHEPSPLNLIAIGRGVLLVDTLVDDYPVLVHGVVASDHVLMLQLLELHLQVIIKKHQHEITQAIACLVYYLQ